MRLSKNFDSSEFDCSCGGCCGGGKDINSFLIKLLEKLRSDCGDYPLNINSGYRCALHNLAVGGATKSQHVLGNAADVACPPELTYMEFYHACCECQLDDGRCFDGIGYYPDLNFVHVDVRYDGLGDRICW